MIDGPSKIELTVCTGCRYKRDVGHTRLTSEAVTTDYGCTNPDGIAHTMPAYSFRVFGEKPERWVQFIKLDKVAKWPVPCGGCPFVKKET